MLRLWLTLILLAAPAVAAAEQGAQYVAPQNNLVFNPFTFDRFGVGAGGVPGIYGYGSTGQLGYAALTGGGYSIGIDDFSRGYNFRPDVLLDQANVHVLNSLELADKAKSVHGALLGNVMALEQAQSQAPASYERQAALSPGVPVSSSAATLILKSHCAECHMNGSKRGGVNLDNFFATAGCREIKKVLDSVVRADTPEKARMPLGKDPLLETEIAALKTYLAQACAQGAAAPGKQGPVGAQAPPPAPEPPKPPLMSLGAEPEYSDAASSIAASSDAEKSVVVNPTVNPTVKPTPVKPTPAKPEPPASNTDLDRILKRLEAIELQLKQQADSGPAYFEIVPGE